MKRYRVSAAGGDGPPTGPERSFRTVNQISETLQVCVRTVRRWLAGKNLRSHQFGGMSRVAAADLIVFITNARRVPACATVHNPLEETFYTVENIAEILNVCVRTIRRRIADGALVAHDFHGIIRIAGSDLCDFIERGRRD